MSVLVQLVDESNTVVTTLHNVDMDYVAHHAVIPDGEVNTPCTYFFDHGQHVLTFHEDHWV